MKSLLSFAGIAVLALALQAVKAEAQILSPDSTSNSSAGSNSDSRSRSDSSSRSQSNNAGNRQTTTQGLTLNQNSSVPANQQFTTNGTQTNNNTTRDIVSGGTNNSNVSSGYTSSDNIVRTTPTVYAPPVSGGNPCTLAVSGGVSVIGWGAAAGGTFVDEDCANRQKIAMIHNAGYAQAARELMCNDRSTYYAFRGTPTPCSPRPQFDGTATAGPVAPAPPPMPLGPQRVTSTQQPAFQPSGRLVCMDMRGREVSARTPGASCGYI